MAQWCRIFSFLQWTSAPPFLSSSGACMKGRVRRKRNNINCRVRWLCSARFCSSDNIVISYFRKSISGFYLLCGCKIYFLFTRACGYAAGNSYFHNINIFDPFCFNDEGYWQDTIIHTMCLRAWGRTLSKSVDRHGECGLNWEQSSLVVGDKRDCYHPHSILRR